MKFTLKILLLIACAQSASASLASYDVPLRKEVISNLKHMKSAVFCTHQSSAREATHYLNYFLSTLKDEFTNDRVVVKNIFIEGNSHCLNLELRDRFK